MSVFWVMPFAKKCRIALVNLSKSMVNVVEAKALVGPWTWDDRSMHFHATWRQLTDVSSFREGTTKPEEGAYDVNFVEVMGQGVYVGDTLTIFNNADAWWGEGDEKVFVDGEAFPSHIGTGTEDYYGYAWCRPEFFSSPFHAQPNGSGNITKGYSVNSRYRAWMPSRSRSPSSSTWKCGTGPPRKSTMRPRRSGTLDRVPTAT